ncbi:autotransporter-associated beta strand repeat-containing protein [Haloferula sp. BvORR071]|uniref:autotransporter-associated beta strand repeat-containing protein n=1 Tax=Haloferula sp. BvORR071 TaxID=1396141 RepID=UPI000554FFBC|nr:autotransporter-associated beta strand repeat-containing protein [Haloferula sp. BvORR071]
MNPPSLRLTAFCSLSCITTLGAAPLLPGKKLGVDYGPTLTANWNNFTAVGTKAAGTVIHLDGSVSDGVVMTVANGQFFNNDGTNNWVGLQSNTTNIAPNPKAPPEFVDSVTTDIAGNFSLGDGTPFKLTVDGLNPWLSYKVDAVSAATGGPIDTITIIGSVTYPASAITRSTAVASGRFHHFDSVVPNSAGALVMDTIDSSSGANPIVNGVLFEAVAPTADGLLDNDHDGMPNWWEFAYQFNPADSSDGAADADGDGFSNAAEAAGGSDPRSIISVPTPPQWAVDGDGAWGSAGSWNPATVPNGVDKVVRLSASTLTTATAATIATNLPVTLGSLEVSGDKPFTLGAANPITFSTSLVSASLASTGANQNALTFLGGIVLASPLEVNAAMGSGITLKGSLTESGGPQTITKNGGGDLILAGDTSAFTGNVVVSAGQLVLNRSGSASFLNLVDGSGSLVITGGGSVTLPSLNTHSGGTQINGNSTLVIDQAGPLGSGALRLDGGVLRAEGSVDAIGKPLNVGPLGATVEVTDEFFLLATGGSAASTGTVAKTGRGTWQISGGNAGTIGTFTVAQGFLDLARNDAFGNHVNSQQDMVIGVGARVTNGAGNTGFNSLRSVTLSGGELAVTNSLSALTGTFQAYGIKESLTVTGTTPSKITDELEGTNGAINIGGTTDLGGGRGADLVVDVGDATSNSNADLTISAKLKNSANASYAALRTGLIKEGPGTLVLTRPNTYTGDTSVNQGVLSLREPYLSSIADVAVSEGAILNLDFEGIAVIDQLSLAGTGMAAGEYGALGSAAPVIATPFITGSGTLLVSGDPVVDVFADWISTNYPSLLAPDKTRDADPDHDGLSNFEEFAFAGNPASATDAGLRRFALESAGSERQLTLTIACRDGASFTGTGPMSATVDGVNYTVRGSTDLTWPGSAIEEITAVTTGLPASPPAGFSYHSFRLTAPVSASTKGFLQAKAEAEVAP